MRTNRAFAVPVSTALRKSLPVFSLLLLAACGDKTPEPVVIGSAGGTVEGPSGVVLTVPAGALSRDIAMSITKADPKDFPALYIDKMCGDAYVINPSTVELKKPVEVTLPNAEECTNAAVLVGLPGRANWAAFESIVEGKSRRAALPVLGVFGTGPLKFIPGQDTVLYVGSRMESRVVDFAGRIVSEVRTSLRTSNPELLSPDSLTGIQTAKAEGSATLNVVIPILKVEKPVRVHIVPNPSRLLLVLEGKGQSGPAGSPLNKPVVVQVQDAKNVPVAHAWVDFFGEDEAGRVRLLGGGVTDVEGRYSFTWLLPNRVGEHRLDAKVSGADVKVSITATATAAQ